MIAVKWIIMILTFLLKNFDNVTETLTNTDMLVTNIQEYIQNNQSNSELKVSYLTNESLRYDSNSPRLDFRM